MTTSPGVVVFSDSGWARSLNDMNSIRTYIFTLGNGVFSMKSRKQDTIAQSTAKVEYIAICEHSPIKKYS